MNGFPYTVPSAERLELFTPGQHNSLWKLHAAVTPYAYTLTIYKIEGTINWHKLSLSPVY